jgi:type IV pilus assembly protein PilQ
MRRVCTLATLTAVALLGAGRARAAHIDGMSPVDRRAAVAVGAVTALSVLPGDGSADVVISLSGQVTVQDFTVTNPPRIVLDLSGARLTRLERSYDRQLRGGINNIRMSQYKPDVVRIVIDLDASHSYKMARSDAEVRVSIATTQKFAAWHSSRSAQTTAASAPAPQVERAPAPANPAASAPPSAPNVAAGAVAAAPPPAAASRPTAPAASDATRNPAAIDSAVAAAQPAEVRPAERRVITALPTRLFTQQSQQRRITVTWQNADIREVIAGFAETTNRTIVIGKNVQGTVTAEIKDQPWDVALKSILDAQGLAAIEESSGIITVDSYQNILEKQASEPLTTQMVNVNYVSAGSLVQTVEGLLSKDCPQTPPPVQNSNQPPGQSWCLIRGNVSADSGTNSLIVTEVSSRLPALLTYIKQLDVRTPQVALKAKIISVNRTQIEQLGLSYDLGSSAAYFNTLLPRNRPGSETSADDREGRVTLGGDVLAGVANASRKYKNGAALNLLFSTALGNYSLTTFLDALREQQLSDVQAEPSVVTLDNRQARILVGQETPVRVIDAGSAAQIGQPVRANVQFKETGIILTVTPHITNNRQIRMSISAEQSELRIIGGDLGFTIDKRNATTQLLVNDGETAVIGGLTQTQIVKNKSGIPLLTDLPLLGWLFSQTDTREEKRDLLILITPHIIDEGEAVRPPDGSRN